MAAVPFDPVRTPKEKKVFICENAPKLKCERIYKAIMQTIFYRGSGDLVTDVVGGTSTNLDLVTNGELINEIYNIVARKIKEDQ
jgi:hypothetical protein